MHDYPNNYCCDKDRQSVKRIVTQVFHAFDNKQLEACRSLISTLETKYPESDFPCLMKASLLHREKHSDKAVELLKVCNLCFINTLNILFKFLVSQSIQFSVCRQSFGKTMKGF